MQPHKTAQDTPECDTKDHENSPRALYKHHLDTKCTHKLQAIRMYELRCILHRSEQCRRHTQERRPCGYLSPTLCRVSGVGSKKQKRHESDDQSVLGLDQSLYCEKLTGEWMEHTCG